MSNQASSLFEDAAKYLSSATSLSSVSNETKLELYGLFKVVTVSSDPTTSRPSLFDFTGRAKWDAWKNNGEKWKGNEVGAQERYLELARNLGWKPGEQTAHEHQPREVNEKTVEELLEEDESSSPSASGSGAMGARVSTLGLQESSDDSSIHAAAINENVQVLLSFLSSNADVDINALDEHGFTPLHLACDRGYASNAKILLEHGADTTIKDADGYTALDLAKEIGHEEVITLLEAHPTRQ